MSWSGVKKQSYEQEIKSWCDEMGIENYTINSKGEIDVDGDVLIDSRIFNDIELPYKFGTIKGFFSLERCKNLTSLKNCPNEVGKYFSCSFCSKIDSLDGFPKEVGSDFWCVHCRRLFTKQEVKSLCKVKGDIY